MFEPSIEKGKAESQTAQTLANTTKLENLYRHQAQSSRDLVKLLNQKEPITSETIKEHVVKTMTNAGAPQKAIDTALMDLPTGGTDKENRAFIARHATNSFSAEAQLEKLFPGSQMVSTGQQTVPTATGSALAYIPPGTQQGPAIQQQLPPTTQSVAQPGDNSGLPPGTPYFLGPQGQPQVGQAPQGVTPSMMSQPKITSGLAPATTTNIEVGTNLINKSRTSAGLVPNIQFTANQAIKLAGETNVGKGAEYVAVLQGQGVLAPGMDWTGSADNFNKLGHNLSQQTALLSQNPAIGGVMATTDQGRNIAGQIAGTTQWTKGAIQYTSRVNRALSEATSLFNKGVNKSQEISQNNPIAANQFQNKWNDILDVNSVRLMDAYKNKNDDPEAYKEVVKELGGVKSPVFQNALKRVDEINNLVSKGQ